MEITIELLSPLVIQGASSDLLRQALRLSPKPPRYYRVWRTGLYPDETVGTQRTYGIPLTDGDLPLAWQESGVYYVGQAREAVRALPDGSRLTLASAQAREIAQAFTEGLGRADWAALGWGQLFVRREAATAVGGVDA